MYLWRHILLICVFLIYLSGSETPWSSYPILDIYPNTSITFKSNSRHNISCIADNPRFNAVIRLYQIEDGKYYIRANTTSNVLKTELNLTDRDNGTSLQCYLKWKYHTKATKTIDLLLNGTNNAKSGQDGRIAVFVVPSQLTLPNAESYSKNFCLVITIVIIMLLVIIIFVLIKKERSKSQGILPDCVSSHSANYIPF